MGMRVKSRRKGKRKRRERERLMEDKGRGEIKRGGRE